jgi:DNA invertase Pin-like site-specific DNA recombinase
MRKSPTPVPKRLPVAHSYLRFSTPKQEWGDSTRRQVEGSQAWSERTGVPLSDLSLASLGVSAFRGKHRSEKQDLGRFLELAKKGDGPVRRGDYLVIENLDRLSREEERTALRLWLDILDAGINIVQLSPETVFRHERSDIADIIRAIIELSRGHSESRMRSVRNASAWAEKLRRARSGECQPPTERMGDNCKVITRRLPAWVERCDGQMRLIPERAAVVKRMFDLTSQGFGAATIARILTNEKVPPFGDYTLDEEDHRKAKKGKRLGCGAWRRIYVSMVLRDRRAIGEFQPKVAGRRPDGPPIRDYYPPVISEKEFYATRAAIASHKKVPPGRTGTGVANLFTGLIHDALNPGGTYAIGQRVDRGRMSRILKSNATLPDGHGGAGRGCSFPYPTFERAILSCLRELKPAEVLGTSEEASDATVIDGELSWTRSKIEELRAVLLSNVGVVAEELSKLEAREAELVAKREQAQEEAVKPLSESWRESQSLVELLDSAPDREDIRLRLRTALRRIIDKIMLLVVHRGKTVLAEARVYFSNGGFRSFVIYHRGPRANIHGRSPGRWRVCSVNPAADGLPFCTEDLRDPTFAELVRSSLENTPMASIDELLASPRAHVIE